VLEPSRSQTPQEDVCGDAIYDVLPTEESRVLTIDAQQQHIVGSRPSGPACPRRDQRRGSRLRPCGAQERDSWRSAAL